MVTADSCCGLRNSAVGKIASIDRGWLPVVEQGTTLTDAVGKIASIDRGWLRVRSHSWLLRFSTVGKIASIDRGWLHD